METERALENRRMRWGIGKQLLATLIVNLSSLTIGVMVGVAMHTNLWFQTRIANQSSPAVIGSWDAMRLIFFGAVCAVLISYYTCERLGRRYTLLLMGIPIALSNVLVRFPESSAPFALSYCFGGAASSMCFFTVPIYVAEISCDTVRGRLSNLRMIFITSGIAMGFTLTDSMNYIYTANLGVGLLVIFLLAVRMVPESPSYLVKKSQFGDATRSLMWLRNNDLSSVENELARLTDIFDATINTGGDISFSNFINLFRDQATLIGWSVLTILFFMQSFFAVNIVLFGQNVILRLIQESPRWAGATIPVGLIQISASICSAGLIDRIGRRPLIFLSCMAMAIYPFYSSESSMPHGIPNFYTWAVMSATVVSFAGYYFGMGPVPLVIAVEIFREKALIHVYTISMVIAWSSMYMFCELLEIGAFGLEKNTFIISNVCLCVCCFSLTYYLIPETKGKTRDQNVQALSTNSLLLSLTGYFTTR